MNDELIHPAVRVGHVHLRVADLDRALGRLYLARWDATCEAAADSLCDVKLATDEVVGATIEQYNKVRNQLAVNRKKAAELQKRIGPLSQQAQQALDQVSALARRSPRSAWRRVRSGFHR